MNRRRLTLAELKAAVDHNRELLDEVIELDRVLRRLEQVREAREREDAKARNGSRSPK